MRHQSIKILFAVTVFAAALAPTSHLRADGELSSTAGAVAGVVAAAGTMVVPAIQSEESLQLAEKDSALTAGLTAGQYATQLGVALVGAASQNNTLQKMVAAVDISNYWADAKQQSEINLIRQLDANKMAIQRSELARTVELDKVNFATQMQAAANSFQQGMRKLQAQLESVGLSSGAAYTVDSGAGRSAGSNHNFATLAGAAGTTAGGFGSQFTSGLHALQQDSRPDASRQLLGTLGQFPRTVAAADAANSDASQILSLARSAGSVPGRHLTSSVAVAVKPDYGFGAAHAAVAAPSATTSVSLDAHHAAH